MKYVKIAALLLSILLILCMTGCGGTPQSNLSPDAARAETENRLKQLGLALIRYRARHNDISADLSTSATMQEALKDYLNEKPVGGAEIFTDAETETAFQPNPSISKTNITQRDDIATLAMAYEAQPSANDTRAVLFADGHVNRISETDWPALKQSSKIP